MAQNEKILVDLILNDKDFKKGINDAVKDTKKLEKSGKSGTDTLVTGFKAAGAAILAMGVLDLAKDMQKLAAESQSVKSAFRNSFDNAPETLRSMQEATGGTVNNLSLMQKALNAKNLKIPVETLNAGLKLARQRAAETGESVEFLAQSVVLGLGRESALILDNLGISAKRLSEETAKTGDFMKAAADIINTELKNAPPTITTLADAMAQNTAEIENMKEQLATELTPVFEILQKEAMTFLNILKDTFELDAEFKFQKKLADAQETFHKAAKGYADDMKMIFGEGAASEIQNTIDKLNKKIAEGEKELRNSNEVNIELMSTINDLSADVSRYTLALEYLKEIQEDTSKGAIQQLNDKIKTQKELIAAAAEKDLPALNFQLQLMEERLNKLQNIGRIELPDYNDISRMAGMSGGGDTVDTTGRDPVNPFSEEQINRAKNLGTTMEEINKQLTASDMLAVNFTENFVDGLWDAIETGENFGQIMQDMIKSTLKEITALIVKTAVLKSILGGATGGTGLLMGFPGFAKGTRNFGGGLALVGEHGPELVSMGSGSNVYSRGSTMGMMNNTELYSKLRGNDIILSNRRTIRNNLR